MQNDAKYKVVEMTQEELDSFNKDFQEVLEKHNATLSPIPTGYNMIVNKRVPEIKDAEVVSENESPETSA